jgi:hypothetical protein
LERLQKDLPFVKFNIDGRECLQRVINAMLHYFGWDNTHLFECKMPRRGSLPDGAEKLVDALGPYLGFTDIMYIMLAYPNGDAEKLVDALGPHLGYADIRGSESVMLANPKNLFGEEYSRRHIHRRLEKASLTWADIATAVQNPQANGPWRKLQGSAFEPIPFGGWRFDGSWSGGHLELERLLLEAGDRINVTYDFGDMNEFTLQVESVFEHTYTVLPELTLGKYNKTRAALLEKGNVRIPHQYSGFSDDEDDDDDDDSILFEPTVSTRSIHKKRTTHEQD